MAEFLRSQVLWTVTVDEDEIDSMVDQALLFAKVDVTEKYMHASCVHAANITNWLKPLMLHIL